MEEKTAFLSTFEQFEREMAGNKQARLQRLRRKAIERFQELGFPTPRDEDWKFTSVAPITRQAFELARPGDGDGLSVADVRRLNFEAGDGVQLVFVNGHLAKELSSPRALPPGLVACSLAEALDRHPEWVEPHLGRQARYDNHVFTALNTAFLHDGAFVAIPKGMVVAEPIYLVFLSLGGGQATVSHPRNLVVAGADSRVTIVENYAGLEDDVYFTNAVTEIVAGEQAVIDHYKLQRESLRSFHVATLAVRQEHRSSFSSHLISLGGSLVRNEVRAALDAEGCECTLNGLYMAADRQHVDNHTVIDHARPRCSSHELYKGILDGKAHGVFNGKIFVHQDAQKTDAKQTNKTLLLSDDATINTKPQLEIYADDVKCTHGATVGQLDEDSIFYLRSRGIGLAEARGLLTYAFANDVIGRIQVEPVRTGLEDFLLSAQHLPKDAGVQEEAP